MAQSVNERKNGYRFAQWFGNGCHLLSRGVFWRQSLGLAIVIALAMVSSLMIAGSAGAVVPITLKNVGWTQPNPRLLC